MTGRLTTHVLDTALGMPAAGVMLLLTRAGGADTLAEMMTNADGRCDAPILGGADLTMGAYELLFRMGPYFARHHPGLPRPYFLDDIVVRFGVAAAGLHYHVPLLVSPFGYSTYRGS